MANAFHKQVLPPEKVVPFMKYAVDEHMTTLDGNRLVSLIRLKGISHETRDDDDLIRSFYGLNRYFVALGKKEGKNLMLQTYVTKTPIELNTDYVLPLEPLQEFVDAYTAPFRDGTFLEVGYSLALVLKYGDLDDGIRRMSELLSISQTMLSDYEPSFMGLKENEHGSLYSETARYFGMLINGHYSDVLVSDTRLGEAMVDSVTSFAAYDFVENRPNRGGQRFATTYDLRDYPGGGSYPGMWDEAIEQQFAFTLVQTFIFEDRNKAKQKFRKHIADLESVEGDSKQTKELEEAIQDITMGDKAFGLYHASLIVYGDTPDAAMENGRKMDSVFTVHDAKFIRSTMSNIDTWCTQYPGVTEAMYPMTKSTENLACSFSLHATPTGKATGNPLGDGTGLMPMLTPNKALYVVNTHDSLPGQDNRGEKLPGHTALTGATGVGKTTLAASLLTFASRFNPMIFCIDYNEALKHILQALGTQYFTIKPGVFTGMNPFQLPDSPELRQMLFDMVRCCAGRSFGDKDRDEEEDKDIQDSIDAVLRYSNVRKRGMSLLLQNLSAKGRNSLHSRLSKWCRSVEGREGHYAWVLDSPVHQFDPYAYRRLAFDCTKILDKEFSKQHPDVVQVLLSILFYLKRAMHGTRPGSLMLNYISEYWAPLSYERTAHAIFEILKSGRMRGEILLMDTQSPEDALASPYAPAVIQQMITNMWLANDKANASNYEKFGVRGRVFEAIQEMGPLSRELVVVQGHKAVKLKMEFSTEVKYWLPLLSATAENVAVAERIRQELGTTDPKVWVDAYLVAENVRLRLKTQDVDVWLPAYYEAIQLREQLGTRSALIWMPAFAKKFELPD